MNRSIKMVGMYKNKVQMRIVLFLRMEDSSVCPSRLSDDGGWVLYGKQWIFVYLTASVGLSHVC